MMKLLLALLSVVIAAAPRPASAIGIEDIVDDCWGVQDIENRLRVQTQQFGQEARSGSEQGRAGSSSGGFSGLSGSSSTKTGSESRKGKEE